MPDRANQLSAASPGELAGTTTKTCVSGVGNLSRAGEFLAKEHYLAAWNAALAAIEVRPFHPAAYFFLADIAHSARDDATAQRCVEHALWLAPGLEPAAKWHGSEPIISAASRWPQLDLLLNRSSQPRLSICLIVKNEEHFLSQCLRSVRDLAWQTVVMDTGSTDRTTAIATEAGAEVHHFDWCDDFSAARNAALQHARGDWVLCLDADEEIPETSRELLRQHLADRAVMAYRLPITEVGRRHEGCAYVPRLFRNAPGVYFRGRVHEHAFASLESLRQEWGLENRLGTAALLHHGYAQEVTRSRGKTERNLRLLERALTETPSDPNLLMNLGLELVHSGDSAGGLTRYLEAYHLLSKQRPNEVTPELRETLLTQLSTRLMAEAKHAEIIQTLNSPLARSEGLTASLHFTLGLAYIQLGQFAEGATQMSACLAKRDQVTLSPVNAEIHKAGPHHCLALCLVRLQQIAEAEAAFRSGLEIQPGSRPLRLEYARFQAGQGRPAEALQLLYQLVSEDPQDAAAWELGGEIALRHRETGEVAREWTAESHRLLPENAAVASQHAEALLLGGEDSAARPIWHQLSLGGDPRGIAGTLLCDLLSGQVDQRVLTPPEEISASQAFLKHYRRLLAAGADQVIYRIHDRRERLAAALPTAARHLASLLTEVEAPCARSKG